MGQARWDSSCLCRVGSAHLPKSLPASAFGGGQSPPYEDFKSSLLTKGEAYLSQAMEDYERSYAARKLNGLARQAEALGYRLEPKPAV